MGDRHVSRVWVWVKNIQRQIRPARRGQTYWAQEEARLAILFTREFISRLWYLQLVGKRHVLDQLLLSHYILMETYHSGAHIRRRKILQGVKGYNIFIHINKMWYIYIILFCISSCFVPFKNLKTKFCQQNSVYWLEYWYMIRSSLCWWWWAKIEKYVGNVKWLQVLGKRLDRGLE